MKWIKIADNWAGYSDLDSMTETLDISSWDNCRALCEVSNTCISFNWINDDSYAKEMCIMHANEDQHTTRLIPQNNYDYGELCDGK